MYVNFEASHVAPSHQRMSFLVVTRASVGVGRVKCASWVLVNHVTPVISALPSTLSARRLNVSVHAPLDSSNVGPTAVCLPLPLVGPLDPTVTTQTTDVYDICRPLPRPDPTITLG